MQTISEQRTYGAEAEYLAVTANGNHQLRPLTAETNYTHRSETEPWLEDVDFGLDSTRHLGELGGMGYVSHDLVETFRRLTVSLSILINEAAENDVAIPDISAFPQEGGVAAYNENVQPKPIYNILRGIHSTTRNPELWERVLKAAGYEDNGRGWKHEVGGDKASLQPWTSLNLETAHQEIAALQATGFVFNLLGANSPYNEGRLTGKRDTRVEMWDPEVGIMSTSVVESDRKLVEPVAEFVSPDGEVKGLASYYKYTLGNLVPMVVPAKQVEGNGAYKSSFWIPAERISALEYLKRSGKAGDASLGQDPTKFYSEAGAELTEEQRKIKFVEPETGDVVYGAPSVGDFFNGFDFMYFPRHSARLRVNLPQAGELDPYQFAKAIENEDNAALLELMGQGGIAAGHVCAEGRVSAINLPTAERPGWERTAIPFVLQAGIARGAAEILGYVNSQVTWQQASEVLPALTNTSQLTAEDKAGFNAEVTGRDGQVVRAVDLAKGIWEIAKKYLSAEEQALVGDELDDILDQHRAGAEEQIEFVVRSGKPLKKALIALTSSRLAMANNQAS
jgi:hypothetical protein